MKEVYQYEKKIAGLTVGVPNDPQRISTLEIASYTDLTPDRVRHICSVHKGIKLKIEENLWPGKPWNTKHDPPSPLRILRSPDFCSLL